MITVSCAQDRWIKILIFVAVPVSDEVCAARWSDGHMKHFEGCGHKALKQLMCGKLRSLLYKICQHVWTK